MNKNNKIQNYNNTSSLIHQSVSCFSGPLPRPDILKFILRQLKLLLKWQKINQSIDKSWKKV